MNKDTKRKKSNKKSDRATTNAQDERNRENKLSSSDIQETEEGKGGSKPIGATATAQDIDERNRENKLSSSDIQETEEGKGSSKPIGATATAQDIDERNLENKLSSSDIQEREEGKGSSKPILATATAQDIDERKYLYFVGDTQDIDKSSSDYFTPTNSPQCVAGKLKDGGNNKITGDVQSETQSFEENTTNQNKSTTGICVNNPACDNQTEGKSKKKPRKRNKKSAKTASNPSEGQEVTSPNSVSEKDKSQTLVIDQNVVEHHQNILQRIKQLQTQSSDSKPLKARIKSFKEMKKKANSDIKKKQADFSKTVDGLDDPPYDDSENDSSIRPIIILMDKATQTDTLPQYPSIPRFNDSKSDSTLDSNSDTLIETKPTTSTLHQSVEEADQKTDSEEPNLISLI